MKRMKKNLFCILLLFGMLFAGAARAEDVYMASDLVLKQTEAGYTADFFIEKNQEDALFEQIMLLVYSEDGRLLSVTSDYDFSPAGVVVPYHWEISIPEGEEPEYAKVCIWDDYEGMTPLATAEAWDASDDKQPQKTVISVDIENYEYVDDSEFICTDGTSYPLDWDVNFVINGFENCDVYQIYEVIDYIKQPFLLSDTDADGDYDIICVTAYITATVDTYNKTLQQIRFSNSDGRLSMYINNNTALILNGNKITAEELKRGDILSILYDPLDFSDSQRYKILVSREMVTGKFISEEEKMLILDSGNYPYIGYLVYELDENKKYIFRLDAFGNIFEADEYQPVSNLAILEDYIIPEGGSDYVATLYCSDGSVKQTTVDTDSVTTIDGNCSSREPIDIQIQSLVYPYVLSDNYSKDWIIDRVVYYELSPTTGEIVTLYPVSRATYTSEAIFNKGKQTVGTIQLNNTTKVIDAIEYNNKMDSAATKDLSLSHISAFATDLYYTLYAFGNQNDDGSYPLVIVTFVEAPAQDLTLSVLLGAPSDNFIEVLHDSEERYLYISEDVVVNGSTLEGLKKGDIVLLTFNRYEEISQIDVILTADAMGIADYNTLKANAESGAIQAAIRIPEAMKNATTSWSYRTDGDEINPAKDVTRLLFGPILEKGSRYFSLASYANGTVGDYTGAYSCMHEPIDFQDGGYVEIDVTDYTDFYVYDYNMPSHNRLDIDVFSLMMSSSIPNQVLVEDYYIPWGNVDSSNSAVHYAFVRVVDGEAAEVYYFLAK